MFYIFHQPDAKIDWSQYWNPAIYIENAIGEPKETSFRLVTYNEEGEATIHEKKRVKGVFLESLELKDFPFDVQVGVGPLIVCNSLTYVKIDY